MSQLRLATGHQLPHHMGSAVSRAPCREEARNSGQVIPGRHQSFLPVLTAPCLRMSDGCHQGIAEAFLPHGVLRLATLGYIDCRRLPGAAVVNHAVDNRKNVRTPPKTLFVWCFINARYTALAAIVSIARTKTFPAWACRREPLRKDSAVAPDSIPRMPAEI